MAFNPNDPHMSKDWSDILHWFGDKRHFRPWYDDDADYNTNAKSYYDFLARFIRQLDDMIQLINSLLKRDIQVNDTNTVDMTKIGSWQSGHMCNGQLVDDNPIVQIQADVKISKTADNAISAKSDGIYATDYSNAINAIKKLLENLKQSGAWTQDGDTIFDGHLNPGRDLATGNINAFGGTPDGSSFIRTNSGKTENDITAGI